MAQVLNIVSELRRGEPVTAKWNIHCKNVAIKDLPILYSQAVCNISAGSPHTPEATFQFSFEEIIKVYKEPYPLNPRVSEIGEENWMKFLVRATHISPKKTQNLRCEMVVDFLNEAGMVEPLEQIKYEAAVEDMLKNEVTLREQAIKLGRKVTQYYPQNASNPKNVGVFTACPQKEMLRLSIQIVLLYSTNIFNGMEQLTPEKVQESVLLQDLKRMYIGEDEIYPDIKLEMEDKVTLAAHKFILAARSEVLRSQIEGEAKKGAGGSTGKIKLEGVESEPMKAILHWMYTGELEEKAGTVMSGIVKAAVKYQLIDLMGILDKKLITICNKRNMFELYKVAQENGMLTAVADVGKFITENINNGPIQQLAE